MWCTATYNIVFLFLQICYMECFTGAPENVHSYLKEKLQYSNKKLNILMKNKYKRSVDIKILEMEYNALNYTSTNMNAFMLFNKTYVVMDKFFYHLTSNSYNNSFELNLITKFPNMESNVSFIKSKEYKELGIVLIGFAKDYVNIYGYLNNTEEWFFIQSIKSSDNPVDANFFENRNKLYLIIINNIKHSSTYSKIYKWTKTYFDEIDRILTKSAFMVVTFSYKDSELILIMGGSLNYKKMRCMEVFEFNGNKSINKQLMLFKEVKSIIIYQYFNKTYIITFHETENSTLFQWDESEFIFIHQLEKFASIQKVLVSNIDGKVVIFLIQQNNILVLLHSTNSLILTAKEKFNNQFIKILDVKLKVVNTGNKLIIFGLTEKHQLSYTVISFNLSINIIVPQHSQPLIDCINELEERLESNLLKLEEISAYSEKVVHYNQFIPSDQLIIAPGKAENINTHFNFESENYQEQVNKLNEDVVNIEEKLKIVNTKLETANAPNKTLDGKLKINGTLNVTTLRSEDLNVKLINHKLWFPDAWLSYSKNQTISGHVMLKNLEIDNLHVPVYNKLFHDILFSKGNQNISSSFVVKSLTADNIHVKRINNITLEDLYLQSNPRKIYGTKTINTLITDSLINLSEKNVSEELLQLANSDLPYEFSSNLFIKNFYCKEINNINWNIFKDSIFRIGLTNRITGDVYASSITSQHLNTDQIFGIKSNSLFTSTTDQFVTSAFNFLDLIVENIKVNYINNLNFNKFVTPTNNFIKGPVTIDKLYVSEDLIINNKTNIKNGSTTTFQQNYNRTVRIMGDLYLSNMFIAKKAKISINNQEFHPNIFENYWSKSQNQIIPSFVELLNGVTTSNFSTILLNNVAVDSYMVNNLDDKLVTDLVFENVSVFGNILINQNEAHFPDLEQLDLEAVKSTGKYNITGCKTFNGTVTVSELVTNYLDEIALEDTVTLYTTEFISGKKTFEKLIVINDLIADNISTNILNGVELKTLYDRILLIDKPEEIDTLEFLNVTAQNTFVTNVNKINFSEYKTIIDEVYATKVLSKVIVNGNVQIGNVQNVNFINGISVTKFLDKFTTYNKDVRLSNKIKFSGTVVAEEIEVLNINHINIQHLMHNILYRNWEQNVTGLYKVSKINTPNINTGQINDIRTENLVNIKSNQTQNISVLGGLWLLTSIFRKSLYADFLQCDIKTAVNNLQNFPTQHWDNIHILQNVTLWDDSSDLSYILNHAVHSNRENIIDAQVVFQHHVSINDVNVHKTINNINLNEMFNDCVLNNGTPQIVTGRKKFNQLKITKAIVEKNTVIPIINDIDILQLNKSIIHKNNSQSTLIKGPKIFFGGLQASRLKTDAISGVDFENLVNVEKLKKIPDARFDLLEVNNINIDFINDLNVTYVMTEQLLRNSEEEQIASGSYIISNMSLSANSRISVINDVVIDDVVIDNSEQFISGAKVFMHDVVVQGDISIDLLNGEDIAYFYKHSVLHGQNSTIMGNIKFTKPVEVNNDIKTNSINGISMEYLQSILNSNISVIQNENMKAILENIQDITSENIESFYEIPSHYLYLEKSSELQIPIQNVVNAYAVEAKGNVLLHITLQKPGSECSLPNTCNCLMQEIIQITTEQSISTIAESGMQRIFSFEDEEMTIHLFTNSISTSEDCRINSLSGWNESTSVVWMLYSEIGKGKHLYYPETITGYISGVKYFRIKGSIYAVVNRFYEPINNTHNIDSLVYKFTKKSTNMELIQKIPTKGAWVLDVFDSDQGVVLVIGGNSNFEDMNSETKVFVYRFDNTIEQFVLLRTIPSEGCISVSGVVIGSDSQIVIAHRDAPLQILKYNQDYDNYYFYQNLYLDSSTKTVSVFYLGEFGTSDPLLTVVTQFDTFYIYSFKYIEGWKMVSHGEIEGLQTFVPFTLNYKHYLFAASTKSSLLLSVIKHGFN